MKLLHRGKVRDLYDIDGDLLLVASDRLSIYDVVLPTPVPELLAGWDEVRARLTDQVWAEIIERMAEEQKPGGTDAQSLEKLRALLSDTLGLKIAVQLDAQFAGSPAQG